MKELLQSVNWSDIALTGGGIALLINFLLSKFKLTEKINKLGSVISHKLSKLKGPVKGLGEKFGVFFDAKMKKIPVIGTVYENGIEPLLLLLIHLVSNILVMFAGWRLRFYPSEFFWLACS